MGEQLVIQATVAIEKEINGIGLGVLEDGTPFLSGQGLARICGVAPSTIINQKDQWAAGKRENALAKLLITRKWDQPELCLQVKSSIPFNPVLTAYTEGVVMTFLEYYAFESPQPSAEAFKNFRTL